MKLQSYKAIRQNKILMAQGFNVFKMFEKMDTNLTKFYSSKTSTRDKDNRCQCINEKENKEQQLQYYENQKLLISNTLENLKNETEQDRPEINIIIKFLFFMQEYVSKVLALLSRQYLCDCRTKMLGDEIVLNHKVQFLRQQNEKFFVLLNEKSEECEQLKRQIQKHSKKLSQFHQVNVSKSDKTLSQLNKNSSKCLFPLTLRQQSVKGTNFSQLSVCADSENFQENFEKAKPINKSFIRASYMKYFNQNSSSPYKMSKKSKIFQEK